MSIELLELAENYQSELADNDFEAEELAETFKEIYGDLKKLVKACNKEGLEVEVEEIEEYEENFEGAGIEQKQEIIDEVISEINELMEICEDPPEKIKKKYSLMDLVDIFSEHAG